MLRKVCYERIDGRIFVGLKGWYGGDLPKKKEER
jgi:hypothetical protein